MSFEKKRKEQILCSEKWANANSGEQTATSWKFPYLYTQKTRAVPFKCKRVSGMLIGVHALQGVGKSIFCDELSSELYKIGHPVFKYRWGTQSTEEILLDMQERDKELTLECFTSEQIMLILEEFFFTAILKLKETDDDSWLDSCHRDLSRHLKTVKDPNNLTSDEKRDFVKNSSVPFCFKELLKKLGFYANENHHKERTAERYARECIIRCYRSGGEKDREKVINRYLRRIENYAYRLDKSALDRIRKLKTNNKTHYTVIFDLPDYDRRQMSRYSKDLSAIWTFYQRLQEYGLFENFTSQPNLVIALQKELYETSGHFFIGKLRIFELEPFSADELVSYYCENVVKNDEPVPFTNEAIKELAVLSCGVFRRFQNYIATCIENGYGRDPMKIDGDDVTEWITDDVLVKDAKREFEAMFPKSPECRMLTVKTRRMLQKNGGRLPTQELVEKVFDGKNKKASRVLKKLETFGYIERERSGKGFDVILKQKFGRSG